MGVRDEEINRLIKYAEGLNTVVKFKKQKNDNAATWATDGSEISIYTKNITSKVGIALCLIHEIAHHLEHIHGDDRELNEGLDEALLSEEEKKKDRKKIFEWEIKGSKWWETIYKDTDCKFGLGKLNLERDYDLWQYEIYYETGVFPKYKERRKKRKELRSKYV